MGKKLEVHVWKHSDNPTVNNAERKADWWLFGGIYRPVWLEIKPATHIEHFAVDAKMNGNLTADVNLENIPSNSAIEATIIPVGGSGETFKSFSIPIKKGETKKTIQAQWDNVKSWDPEHPNLYNLNLKIVQDGETLNFRPDWL